jgi:hypothetical protein
MKNKIFMIACATLILSAAQSNAATYQCQNSKGKQLTLTTADASDLQTFRNCHQASSQEEPGQNADSKSIFAACHGYLERHGQWAYDDCVCAYTGTTWDGKQCRD